MVSERRIGPIDYEMVQKALRRELRSVGNNIILENVLDEGSLDALWGWKRSSTGQTPVRFTDVFQLKVDSYNWTYIEPKESNSPCRFYSRYAFRYPYMFVELTKVTESWFGIGFENTGGIFAGGIWFELWKDSAGWHPIFNVTPSYAGGVGLDLGDIWSGLRNANHFRLYIKVNKGWAELHIKDASSTEGLDTGWSASDWGVKAIVVFGYMSDRSGGDYGNGVTIKSDEPYYVAYTKTPFEMDITALIEGTLNPGDIIKNLVITDGEPNPPRVWTVRTGTTVWEGYSASGAVTSDPIPVNTYQNKTIYFMADTGGTLEIDVYTVSGNWREYDSVSYTANTLLAYKMTGDALLIRLIYTPSATPATINEANVVME